MNKSFYLEAEIKIQEETAALREAASSVIKLPETKDKQPDLLYFTAIFVSSGANLNGAHFKSSELVVAEDTIINKALDIEHKEEEIIGHLYDRAFTDKEGKPLSLNELKSRENTDLDTQEMHVVIAGIIYKTRFPKVAEEVASGQWRVSMECYYQDYDVKIGNLEMTRQEAEALGLAADDSLFGKLAKVIKKGKEIAEGELERILRGICFSGCGVVKNPANPPSVILETAKESVKEPSDEIIILNYDNLDNNVTSKEVEGQDSEAEDKEEATATGLEYDDSVGICVSYKRHMYAEEPAGPDTELLHEDWCTLYDAACASFSRDTTDPDCLRNQVGRFVRKRAEDLLEARNKASKVSKLTDDLQAALDEAARTL